MKFLIFLLLPMACHAVDSYTPHYGLTKTQVNTLNWDGKVNGNFDTLDSNLYATSTSTVKKTGDTMTGILTINADASGTSLKAIGRVTDDMVWAPISLTHTGAYIGGFQYSLADGVRLFTGPALGLSSSWNSLGDLVQSGDVYATHFYGDGTGLTGTGDNLGNHTATMAINTNFPINSNSDIYAANFHGDGSALTGLPIIGTPSFIAFKDEDLSALTSPTTTVFTLTQVPVQNSLFLAENGLLLKSGADYTLNNAVITKVSTNPVGTFLTARYAVPSSSFTILNTTNTWTGTNIFKNNISVRGGETIYAGAGGDTILLHGRLSDGLAWGPLAYDVGSNFTGGMQWLPTGPAILAGPALTLAMKWFPSGATVANGLTVSSVTVQGEALVKTPAGSGNTRLIVDGTSNPAYLNMSYNGVTKMALAVDNTNSVVDYTGPLLFRAGIEGTEKVRINQNGDITAAVSTITAAAFYGKLVGTFAGNADTVTNGIYTADTWKLICSSATTASVASLTCAGLPYTGSFKYELSGMTDNTTYDLFYAQIAGITTPSYQYAGIGNATTSGIGTEASNGATAILMTNGVLANRGVHITGAYYPNPTDTSKTFGSHTASYVNNASNMECAQMSWYAPVGNPTSFKIFRNSYLFKGVLRIYNNP